MIRQAHWYKNAIIYALDVETFLDSNGDGVGDFGGLVQKLDYLASLGVTCLWLMPFQEPDSFLNWTERLILTRRERPAIGTGEYRFLDTNRDEVFALGFSLDGRGVVILHNLSGDRLTVTVMLDGRLDENAQTIFCDSAYDQPDHERGCFELEPYGYHWIRSSETIG